MYLAVEGIDTAGKSTQIALLQEHFSDALITKEPGGTKAGVAMREIILHQGLASAKAEFFLFLADRAEHMERVIKPHRDRLIISDRSIVSGIAYAMVHGNLDENILLEYNRFAVDNILPEMIVLLELTPEALEYRLSQKHLDGIEARGAAYLLRIQEALLRASELLGMTTHRIDATRSIDAISQEIQTLIQSRL